MTRSFRVLGAMVVGVAWLMLVPAGLAAVNYAATEENLRAFASQDEMNAVVRQLLAQGVNPNAPEPATGHTAVHKAAMAGSAKNLETLLEAGGNPNVQNREGNMPLHRASMGDWNGAIGQIGSDYVAVIRVLLKHGADLMKTNARGEPPLHVAANQGFDQTAIIKVLLAAGARPADEDRNGLTALQCFARNGSDLDETATVLLKAGADPDRKDPRGDAPLHMAINEGGSDGKAEVVEALLDGGADPCVRDAQGYTPYEMSSGMQQIHWALSQAGGGDLDCDKSRMVYEEGAETDDDSEMAYEEGAGPTIRRGMGYEAELRDLEERVEAERRVEAARIEEARRRAAAERRAEAARIEEARRRAAAERKAEAAWREEVRQRGEEIRRQRAEERERWKNFEESVAEQIRQAQQRQERLQESLRRRQEEARRAEEVRQRAYEEARRREWERQQALERDRQLHLEILGEPVERQQREYESGGYGPGDCAVQ